MKKIIEIVKEYSPELKGFKIVDVHAAIVDFYGYKYADENEVRENYSVSIQLDSKLTGKFWVTLFEGTQYKKDDVQLVVCSKDAIVTPKGELAEGAIYANQGFSDEDIEKMGEKGALIKSVQKAYQDFWFDSEGALVVDDSSALVTFIGDILDEQNMVVEKTVINKANPDPKAIKYLEEKLAEAKALLKEVDSDKEEVTSSDNNQDEDVIFHLDLTEDEDGYDRELMREHIEDTFEFPVKLVAKNSNWRGQDGYSSADDAEEVLSKCLGFGNDYLTLKHSDEDGYYFWTSSHDVPTGFPILISSCEEGEDDCL